jgi:hypothetical protein
MLPQVNMSYNKLTYHAHVKLIIAKMRMACYTCIYFEVISDGMLSMLS